MANPEVLAALEQQAQCYQRLAKLAQIQHDHVQNSRTEDLLHVLTQRQELLDQIAELEKCVAPAKRRWHDYLGELGNELRGRAETALAESRRLLELITTADRNDALLLQQRKLNLGTRITRATAARNINRAYATAAYGSRPATFDASR